MIPLIQKEIVDTYHWLTDEEFLDTIAITQAAPGPVAVNSAVFVGYRIAGVPGAVVALLGTVLPSFFVILLIAILLDQFEQNPLLDKFFAGMRPAIVALILSAGLRMGKKSLRSKIDYLIGLVALILLIILGLHPIVLILSGVLWGIIKIYYVRHKGGESA